MLFGLTTFSCHFGSAHQFLELSRSAHTHLSQLLDAARIAPVSVKQPSIVVDVKAAQEVEKLCACIGSIKLVQRERAESYLLRALLATSASSSPMSGLFEASDFKPLTPTEVIVILFALLQMYFHLPFLLHLL